MTTPNEGPAESTEARNNASAPQNMRGRKQEEDEDQDRQPTQEAILYGALIPEIHSKARLDARGRHRVLQREDHEESQRRKRYHASQ